MRKRSSFSAGGLGVLLATGGGCSVVASFDNLTGPAGAADGAADDGALGADTGRAVDGGALGDAASSSDASALGCSDPSLFAYYHFDETSGAVAHDCSANRRDVTAQSLTWMTGKVGGSLALDGQSTCLDLGAMTELTSGPLTIAAWLYITRYTDDAGNSGYIFAKAAFAPEMSGFRLASDDSQTIGFKIGQASGAAVASTGMEPLGSWIFAVAVFDPGKRDEVWIGGTLAATTSPPTDLIDMATHITIGCRAGSSYFSGQLDELRVYKRALSPTEIASISK